ncbi:MAG: hypothetical protein JW934_00600, partial [Anaerolineae bacterium]|nr:hypothetical protein [Anaerolineae bacterium]
MFNLGKYLRYNARVLFTILSVAALLFVASLSAVSIYTTHENQRIIPICPTGLDGDNLTGAIDPDGVIVDAVITGHPIPPSP